MTLRGCGTSHFIWSIKDGMVKKVHNVDSHGRPSLKFKKLEDIYQSADAEYTSKFQDGYDGTQFDGSCAGNEHTSPPYADRKTRARNGYVVKEVEPERPSNEDSFEELTLSQLTKKCKRKKRKASESVLLTPKVDDDDSDLSEPLCKFRVKVSKSSRSKMMPANGSLTTSSKSTQLVASEPSTCSNDAFLFSKDLATVNVKVEAPEVEYFECKEMTPVADDPLICNGPVRFIASESGFVLVNHELNSRKSGSLTNEGEVHGFNEVSLDNLDDINNAFLVPSMVGENMELDNDENMANVILHVPVSEVDKEECVNQPPSILSSLEDDSRTEDLTASTSDCSQSHPYLQQTTEQVNYNSGVQDSDSTIDDGHYCVDLGQVSDLYMIEERAEGSPTSQEYGSPSLMSNDNDDVAFVEAKSATPEEKQNTTSVNADADSSSSNSDNNSFVPEDTCILQEQPSFVSEDTSILQEQPSFVPEDTSILQEQPSSVPEDPSILQEQPSSVSEDTFILHDQPSSVPEDTSILQEQPSFIHEDTSILQEQPSFACAYVESEVKFSNHKCQTDITSEASEIRNSDCIEFRHSERLPSTRKAISPTSQEKLCLAMKSAELLDDVDHYKCKEKLCFGEQAENKFSSTSSDVEDNEPNVHPEQSTRFIQNKVVISAKHILKKPKNYKRGSPPTRCLSSKGCLDGPRLCRSLPRLSTGCTSIQGCSESAIAFSQRQMHDIESLASKLMTELNSMKVIVEEKMLYEAYRSTSLKNEADEVKSAIKSATKTEETARKWLSMMARDCNRFCKIMKLNEDNNEFASADPACESTVEEKPLEREKRKKISFADEAGGTLCDVKVFEIDRASLESKENSES